MNNNNYSSLHNHTYYSIQDGFASPEEYMKRATELGLNAIALTEHGNLYSGPYMHKLKEKYPDIKVLYGVEAYECFDHTVKDPNNKYFHLVILAKNEAGRIAVNKLITQSEFYGKYYKPRMDLEMIKPFANDLVISSACMASKLSREKDFDKCVEYVNEYKSIFPHFYLEMQSHKSEEQAEYNRKVLALSEKTNTPFIITTDSHAATEEQLEYQAVFVQIAHDAETASESYEGCYLQSVEDIYNTMSGQIGEDNVRIGLENTNKIAELCDDVQMPFQSPKLPHFAIPDGYTERSYIEELVKEGWYERGFDKMSVEDQQIRRDRIKEELDTIDSMGFITYFLLVRDAIRWGKENDVLFGISRGSAGSSMVCYLLGITGIEPCEYGLIFSRFLNSERVGMPDIDTDLHPKEKVIEYLQHKYGEMSVCQISNFSYITPGVAIKDVVRILDKSPERFNKYGKKIGTKKSFEIAKLFNSEKWEDCITANEAAIKKYSDEIYVDLFRIAKELSGRVRHVSIHAGGVCVTDTEISDYMPMKVTEKGEHVIQVDKKIVEALGLVKLDFLGLKSLGIINEAIKIAGIDYWEISPDNKEFLTDKLTYDLIGRGDTANVFQLESKSMSSLCERLKPKNVLQVSSILALFRPDTMAVLDDYIARKNGEQEITYLHPDMKPILEETLGLQVYQEQTLQIIRTFGSYSYGKSDVFRRAVSKKIPEVVQEEVRKLHGEIIKTGYSKETADAICDMLKNKGGLTNSETKAPYISNGICSPNKKPRITGKFLRASTTKHNGNRSVA